MHSFLYRGSKNSDQNRVTGVIQAPSRESARLALKKQEIDVYQLEVRVSARAQEIQEVPVAPQPVARRGSLRRSELVCGGCWLFALGFAFSLWFAPGRPSSAPVVATNSQFATVSTRVAH